MRILFTNSTLNIKDGMTVSGVSKRRETLNVIEGRIWLTIEGSPDDYWLGAGDSFVVEPDKLVVVEAYHGDSRVLLSPEQDESMSDMPRRAFDFFRTMPAKSIDPAKATEPQFGYTGNLCQQQQPQAAPARQASTVA